MTLVHPSARTRVFALLGDPVSHSLSPAMHNRAFRAAGRDAVYVALAVPSESVGDVVRALALAGGGGNVTVPHKETTLDFLDERTDAVQRTGACNTFWSHEGRVWGDNTDVTGFLRTWTLAQPRGMEDAVALILGAGGAARAAVFTLLENGARDVWLWNRTAARAQSLQAAFGDPRVQIPTELGEVPEPYVLVNSTPLGMGGGEVGEDLLELVDGSAAVVDMVYGEGSTSFVARARSAGVPAVSGEPMLLGQAEAAYARWFGEPPPVGVMAEALAEASDGPG